MKQNHTKKAQKIPRSAKLHCPPHPRCISCLEVIYCYFRAIRCAAHSTAHLKRHCDTDVPTDPRCSAARGAPIASPAQGHGRRGGQGGFSSSPPGDGHPAPGGRRSLRLCRPWHRSQPRQLQTAGGENEGRETGAVNPSEEREERERIRNWPLRRNKGGKKDVRE